MTGSALLQQIVRGLDGVTPGEWLNEGSAIYALDEGGMVNRFYTGVQGGFVRGSRHNPARTTDAEILANAAHIARCSPDTMREIAAYVQDLEERLAKAAEALEPFAEHAEEYSDDTPDDCSDWPTFEVGDFRRARTALTTIRRT